MGLKKGLFPIIFTQIYTFQNFVSQSDLRVFLNSDTNTSLEAIICIQNGFILSAVL